MKVLGPLVTKQYFDGDLHLDEYNNSIYKAHYNDYKYVLKLIPDWEKTHTSTMINVSMLIFC